MYVHPLVDTICRPSLAVVLPITGPLSYLLQCSYSGLPTTATPPHGPHLSVVQSSQPSRVGEEGSAVYAHERITPWRNQTLRAH